MMTNEDLFKRCHRNLGLCHFRVAGLTITVKVLPCWWLPGGTVKLLSNNKLDLQCLIADAIMTLAGRDIADEAKWVGDKVIFGQTMRDKISVISNKPDFFKVNSWDPETLELVITPTEKALGLRGDSKDVFDPIFVIGCNNSGNSILAKALTSHPDLCGLPDLESPDDYGQYHHLEMQDLPGMPKKLTHFLGKQTARLWASNQFQGALIVTENDFTPLIARQTRTTLGQYVQEEQRLVLTSPANLLRVRLLLAIFPDARFVATVRNPFPVVEGTIRKRLRDPQRPWISGMTTTVQEAAEQWENANVLLLQLQKFLSRRLLIVHYEDLVAKPKVTLNRVWAFLGLSGKGIKIPHFKPNLNQIQAQHLTQADCKLVQQICWPMMNYFGYH
ncbi:MAG: sulfotransferase [Candidatus Buchananbacteria bacterium]